MIVFVLVNLGLSALIAAAGRDHKKAEQAVGVLTGGLTKESKIVIDAIDSLDFAEIPKFGIVALA